MGFGWLFIGYFTATLMTMNPVGFLIRPVGYAIMLYAFLRLKAYHKDFLYGFFASAGMLLLSVVLTADGLSSFLLERLLIGRAWFPASFKTVLGYVEMLGSLAFHTALLWGIRSIAKEIEVEKLSFAAARNFCFLAAYNLLYGVAKLPLPFAKEYASYMSVPVLLLYFACLVLNLVLIFSCYAKICDESDEDMAVKPSRFAFVNEMRAETEERRRQKAEAYAARERERRERKEKKKK